MDPTQPSCTFALFSICWHTHSESSWGVPNLEGKVTDIKAAGKRGEGVTWSPSEEQLGEEQQPVTFKYVMQKTATASRRPFNLTASRY